MSRHVAPPRSRCRLVVERNADQGTTKKPKPVSPDFSAGRRKETGANGSRGDDMNARPLVLLQKAGFGERVRAALADDEVIQHPDIDGGQGTLPSGRATGREKGGPTGCIIAVA